MRTIRLAIGDLDVTRDHVNFLCHGLGTCVGLFIQDRISGISGGAHIFLPSQSNSYGHTGFYFASAAIDAIVERIVQMGGNAMQLRAKFAGGGEVLQSSRGIGEANVTAVRHYLVANRIYIVGSHVGGSTNRSARFNTRTGDLLVQTGTSSDYFLV